MQNIKRLCGIINSRVNFFINYKKFLDLIFFIDQLK
jgi:hypothetical protein